MIRRGIACIAAVVVGMAPSAQAYPQDPNNCNDPTILWRFNSTWANYPTAASWARSSLNVLSQHLDYDGSRLVSVAEAPSGTAPDVTISLDDRPSNSYGTAECTAGASISINRDYAGSSSFIYQVVRHEMGHLIGMEHSGRYDSNNGDDPPMMATCIDSSAFRSTNGMAQDDVGYLNWLHSSVANRQLHANFGFEQGTGFWGRSAGTLEWQSTGGATGPARVRHRTSSMASYLYQTVDVATGDDDETYRAVMNYRMGSSAYQADVRATLMRQTITYSGDNACSYADGLRNLNDPSYSSNGYISMASTGNVVATGKTSWTFGGSGWVNPATVNGYKLQMRVYSHAQDSAGTAQFVYLDNVRGEGT